MDQTHTSASKAQPTRNNPLSTPELLTNILENLTLGDLLVVQGVGRLWRDCIISFRERHGVALEMKRKLFLLPEFAEAGDNRLFLDVRHLMLPADMYWNTELVQAFDDLEAVLDQLGTEGDQTTEHVYKTLPPARVFKLTFNHACIVLLSVGDVPGYEAVTSYSLEEDQADRWTDRLWLEEVQALQKNSPHFGRNGLWNHDLLDRSRLNPFLRCFTKFDSYWTGAASHAFLIIGSYDRRPTDISTQLSRMLNYLVRLLEQQVIWLTWKSSFVTRPACTRLSVCIRNSYIERTFAEIEVGVETGVVLQQVFRKTAELCTQILNDAQGRVDANDTDIHAGLVAAQRLIHLTEL